MSTETVRTAGLSNTLDFSIEAGRRAIENERQVIEAERRVKELERIVTLLRDKLVELLAEKTYDRDYNTEAIGKYFWERTTDFQEIYCIQARKQLAEEMPEVFGEGVA